MTKVPEQRNGETIDTAKWDEEQTLVRAIFLAIANQFFRGLGARFNATIEGNRIAVYAHRHQVSGVLCGTKHRKLTKGVHLSY